MNRLFATRDAVVRATRGDEAAIDRAGIVVVAVDRFEFLAAPGDTAFDCAGVHVRAVGVDDARRAIVEHRTRAGSIGAGVIRSARITVVAIRGRGRIHASNRRITSLGCAGVVVVTIARTANTHTVCTSIIDGAGIVVVTQPVAQRLVYTTAIRHAAVSGALIIVRAVDGAPGCATVIHAGLQAIARVAVVA